MTTPADVLRHEAPTKKFLCPLSANEYGIEFLSFVIQDYLEKKTIFEVSRERPLPIDFSMHDAMDPDSLRKINYELLICAPPMVKDSSSTSYLWR